MTNETITIYVYVCVFTKKISIHETMESSPSTFPALLLLSLLLALSTPFPSAAIRGLHHLKTPSPPHVSPQGQAERLIRALNLFPNETVNLLASDPFASQSGIIEKRIKLTVSGDSGSSIEDLGHHAGYYQLPNTKAARMFYFFFESRNSKQDPVVIWLTGGPGCGSELALFYENGPFKIAEDLTLVWNDYGWDKVSNIIFVDQPTGTGFSYSTDEGDLRHDETGVSNDLYDFLQGIFKQYPDYATNDFFITGESYAGHYIPALASRVQKGNEEKEGIHINLKGFAIGNGLTNSGVQYVAYPEYAWDMDLIDQSTRDDINVNLVPDCADAVDLCNLEGGDACGEAYQTCEKVFSKIVNLQNGINFYDIRKKCVGSLCYDFSKLEPFLNSRNVKEALGVKDVGFVSCSTVVYSAMTNDMMQNLDVGIPALLEAGINVLIYAGEYDLICNWLGNSRWVHELDWSGGEEFKSSATAQFTVDGKDAGVFKNHGPLSFLKVYDAGHMVPMDQPKASLEMLTRWMTKGTLA
ncbi:hypothetical protein MLD38_040175 [Melastoma candidum]|uniref:Uncharacterized protein n=1 Tax=Melastoma candidum TaxID=119954 RepID=A0ACB9L626_9MYRT|nr:hypothetical protein MLD38_040175 [Melastoma candidum]